MHTREIPLPDSVEVRLITRISAFAAMVPRDTGTSGMNYSFIREQQMTNRRTSVRGAGFARKRAALTAGLSIAAVLLTGCVQSEREENTGAEGDSAVDSTFVFAASSDPASLDPAFASDGETFRVSRQIFEGLVGVEAGTADPAPLLAESWETSEDGLSTTFALKEGVTFHDGTDFNAEAVCFNFDRWYNWTGVAQAPSVS